MSALDATSCTPSRNENGTIWLGRDTVGGVNADTKLTTVEADFPPATVTSRKNLR